MARKLPVSGAKLYLYDEEELEKLWGKDGVLLFEKLHRSPEGSVSLS